MSATDRKPGTLMSPEEWKATAPARRALAERDHVAFSKMTVEQCDEAVREEAARMETGAAAP